MQGYREETGLIDSSDPIEGFPVSFELLQRDTRFDEEEDVPLRRAAEVRKFEIHVRCQDVLAGFDEVREERVVNHLGGNLVVDGWEHEPIMPR